MNLLKYDIRQVGISAGESKILLNGKMRALRYADIPNGYNIHIYL